MQALNSNNCLTCLHQIDKDNIHSTNISDPKLQHLLIECLDWQQTELSLECLPKRLCCSCHELLQRFEKFQHHARFCRQQLLDLLNREQSKQLQPAGFEIIYEEESMRCPAGLLLAVDVEVESIDDRTPPDPFEEAVKHSKQAKPSRTSLMKVRKNIFKCWQCGHSFARRLTMDAHVRKVHEGHKRPFKCDLCDKAYIFMGGLYTHIKEIHGTQVRSHRCDYPECGRVYVSRIAMLKHKRLKHNPSATPARKYVCEKCGATFNQTSNLTHHRRSKHPTPAELATISRNSKQFYCDICQKHFHSRYTLKYHQMQQHTDATAQQEQHECKVCGKRMAKRFMLLRHMLTHSQENLPCEHCGRLFARRFELESHIRAVHLKLKPFSCKYCGETFATRKTLTHHEYIHTGEKPYACGICGQTFRQQTCLKTHSKIHDDQTKCNQYTTIKDKNKS